MGATLVLEDESGFSLVSPLKRSWSRRGQTPVVRTSIDHHERLSLLGALLVSPRGRRNRLSIRSYWHSLSGKEVITFLRQILGIVCGPIILVWDRHPIHKRKAVQDFLASHPRVHMEYFPVAAPELNPAEFIWSQTTEAIAGTAPHNGEELQTNVFTAISRTRRSQKRLRACLLGSNLDWVA